MSPHTDCAAKHRGTFWPDMHYIQANAHRLLKGKSDLELTCWPLFHNLKNPSDKLPNTITGCNQDT